MQNYLVVMIGVMIAVGACVSAYVAQRAEPDPVPVRIRRRRD